LLASKTKNLQDAISAATQKVQELKNAQAQMKAAVDSGKAPAEEYEKLKIAVAKAEVQLKSLNAEMVKTGRTDLNGVADKLKPVARIAQAALAGIVALGVGYAKTGDEIQKASEKYRISAEEFQRGDYLFDRATGDGDAYTKALEAVTSQLALLAKGSTKAQANFAQLGLSWSDLQGKSPAAALQIILDRLSQIEDVEDRATKANIILAAAGTEVAQVASLTSAEIEELNAQLEKQGLLSSDEAEKAAELNDKMEDFTLSIKKVVAELGVSLIPLFEALLNMANAVTPVISGIARAFSAVPGPIQAIVAVVLIVLAILPKLISGIAAVNTALKFLGANPVAIKILLIATAVSLLIILLVELAKWLGSIFGKKYDLDVNSSALASGGDIAGSVGQTTNYQASSSTTVNNYYDNSTMNNTIEKEADADEIISKLRINVAGRR
jgi:hypothetical protein